MSDRKVWIALSRDGGHTWSDWRAHTLGEVGQYGKRIRYRRFGRGLNWRMRIRLTSPHVVDILGAVIDADVGG